MKTKSAVQEKMTLLRAFLGFLVRLYSGFDNLYKNIGGIIYKVWGFLCTAVQEPVKRCIYAGFSSNCPKILPYIFMPAVLI